MNRLLRFTTLVTVAHVLTYFLFGALAYALLTKGFYVGDNPVFATFMRTEREPELWRHVMKWFLPAQVLRGILIAAVLYPFLDVFKTWAYGKRLVSIAGLYLVLGFWASAVAAPGTIDGLVYLRPEITSFAHLMVQPEVILQGLAMSAIIAWRLKPADFKQTYKRVEVK